jgi:hypothetical protein
VRALNTDPKHLRDASPSADLFAFPVEAGDPRGFSRLHFQCLLKRRSDYPRQRRRKRASKKLNKNDGHRTPVVAAWQK